MRTLTAIAVAIGMTSVAAAQTTTTEVRNFTVVSVNGNAVVVRDQTGAREITVPDDFRFTVGNKQISVRELKPGMTGSATITTTTTVKPVYVTEVKEGTVMQNTGGMIIVRTAEGYKSFSEADLTKRNIRLMKDGKPAELREFRAGNKLSATIVTEGEPQILTQRQVDATIAAAPASSGAPAAGRAPAASSGAPAAARAPAPSSGAPAGGAPAAASSAPASAPAGAALPKTASQVPLLGAIGMTTLALAVWLTVRRRWHAGR